MSKETVPPAGDVEVLRYGLFEEFVCVLPTDLEQLEAHVTRLNAENARLTAELEDLREDFYLMRHECESAKRNASAFEDRMGDLQVAEGKLKTELVMQRNHFREQLRGAKNADVLQADLTKARELNKQLGTEVIQLLTFLEDDFDNLQLEDSSLPISTQQWNKVGKLAADTLAHQSAPAAKGVLDV